MPPQWEYKELLQDEKTVLHLAALHDADQIAQLILQDEEFPIDSKDERVICQSLYVF